MYDGTYGFSEGLAAVKRNGKRGYIAVNSFRTKEAPIPRVPAGKS